MNKIRRRRTSQVDRLQALGKSEIGYFQSGNLEVGAREQKIARFEVAMYLEQK